MDFSKSRTYKNVTATMNGELKASGRYAVFANLARDDGYEQIGRIFDETAGNEGEHAEIMMRILGLGELPSTKANLKSAISGENNEWTDLYIDFAKTANNEGFYGVGKIFMRLAEVERSHEQRFAQLLCNIEKDQVFCKPSKTVWVCSNCGYIANGKCAPHICPLCNYPQGYFQVKCENY